jgi:hypothetical protein
VVATSTATEIYEKSRCWHVPEYRHAALGAKKASIRVMRGKGRVLAAPHAEGEPGHVIQYSAMYY